jgi:hypothetical protein
MGTQAEQETARVAQGGANREVASERVEIHGRARATPTAAGTDVVGSGVGNEGALPGDRRL